MSSLLQIIHVEDCESDCELIQEMLRGEGLNCHVDRVQTRGELMEALDSRKPDLILSDNTLPQFQGLEALEIAHARRPDLPFIFVSGTIGEDAAIRSLQNGATDYVLKSRLSRLVPAVRRALAEAENRKVRQHMESQLRQARKLETLGTLAGGLAHDFRNVLQIFKMSIALFPLKTSDPEVLQLAEKLDQAADRGCNLVQELMVFARKTDTTKKPVDLGSVIAETVQLLEACLPENVKLLATRLGELPVIQGDKGQIERILTNLVMNARDAMPEGGTVSVVADLIRFKGASESPWKIMETPYIRVQVQDSGSGMNEETLSRIFEPFYTTKPAGKGTGLGLAVVFSLMEAHEGLIQVESVAGKGTVFALYFPAEAAVPGDVVISEIEVPDRLLGEPMATIG